MLPFIQSSYLKNLLESFNTGVVIVNIKGDVYAANESAARLLGTDRAGLLNGRFNGGILDRFEDRTGMERLLARAREEEAKPRSLEVIYTHPSLGIRHYSVSVSRLVEYGKVFGIFLHINDLTHIYELHEREKRMLEEQSAMQRERIDSLANLSMAIAHQIRNPLMTIGGFARLLRRKKNQADSDAEFLDGILSGADRLENIVKAVTEYTTARVADCRETNLGDVLAKTLERLGPLPGNVCLQLTDACPVWSIDPELTGAALFELLQNAVEAAQTSESGLVSVHIHENEDTCLIEVRDHGPGLNEEDVPFLFDPFFTTKAVGVGMGLAKARRWVREQGGELAVDNAQGGGVIAVLAFPRCRGLKARAK